MFQLLYFVNVILLISITSVYSANILVLEGVASPSHHVWIRTLTTELAERGNNVTSLSADIDSSTVPNLHYIHLENVYSSLYNTTDVDDFFEIGERSKWLGLFYYHDFGFTCCEAGVNSKGSQQLLNYPEDFHFDLIIYDYVAHSCLLGFLHRFKYPPLIALTAFGGTATTMNLVGSQFYPHVPHFIQNEYNPTFLNRVENLLLQMVDQLFKDVYLLPKMSRIAAKIFPDSPPVHQLEKLTKVVLINNHPTVGDIEPMLPSVIPVGGLQIQQSKGLPDDLKQIVDNAKNGLILFSLGTNARSDSLGKERLITILESFREMVNYTFIWKFESSDLPVSVPKNVIIRAWIPQSDILAHPNTILFVTHSGLLSTQESVWHGVPMLALPIFGDQFLNADNSVRAGIAEKLLFTNFTQSSLTKLIKRMTENKKYHENVKRLSTVFRDQKESPLDRAIWWVEWVLRNPNSNYLRSPLNDYNLFAKQSFDIISFIVFILIAILYLKVKVFCIFLKLKFTKRKYIKNKRE